MAVSACNSISRHREPDNTGHTTLPLRAAYSAANSPAPSATSRNPPSVISKQTDLQRAAEAVLHPPHHPVAVVAIALEIQHRIDHVLQQPRPGQRPLLRHMAHQDQRAAPSIWRDTPAPDSTPAAASPCPARRADHPYKSSGSNRSPAASAATSALAPRSAPGSYPPTRRDLRRQATRPVSGSFTAVVSLRSFTIRLPCESLGPQTQLPRRLLAGDVQHRLAPAGQRDRGLQHERGLADPRIAAEHGRAALATRPPPLEPWPRAPPRSRGSADRSLRPAPGRTPRSPWGCVDASRRPPRRSR